MKKWMIGLLAAMGCTCVVMAAGCGDDSTQHLQNQINELQNQLNSAAGTSLPQVGGVPQGNPNPDIVASQVVPPPQTSTPTQTASQAAPSQAAPSQTTPSTTVQGQQQMQSGQISLEQAKQIAVKHAGVSNANFIKTQQDMENGRLTYEIDFYAGNMKYDYEIDATSGEVLKFDHEGYAAGNTGTAQGTGDIGAARAQQIALQHAGANASNVWGLKTKLDFENGIRVYEVDFYFNNWEYDYEINAATGAIMKYDRDWD